MAGKVIRIERISPRGGVTEEPDLTERGYCLGNPMFGAKKHHAENAVFVNTLEEAAELILKGFSLRMVSKDKRASLISPKSLRIIRE